MLNTGITGVRGYAGIHHTQISRLEAAGLVRLHAVVVPKFGGMYDASDEDMQSLADRKLAIFDSIDEFLEQKPDIDTMFLPVGIPLHRDLSVRCLEAGYNVVCEKPLAGSVADADSMIDARKRSGKRLIIAYQFMYHPSIEFVRGLAQSGAYGRLLRADTLVLWPRKSTYFTRNGWAGRFETRGVAVRDCPLNNACAHFFQNMLYVSSSDSEISSDLPVLRADNFRSAPIETADTQDVEAAEPHGPTLRMIVSHACEAQSNTFTVYQFEDKHVYWLHEGLVVTAPPETTPRYADRASLDAAVSSADPEIRMIFDGSHYDPVAHAFDSIVQGLTAEEPLPSEVDQCRAHASIVEQALPDVNAIQSMPGTVERTKPGPEGSTIQSWTRPGIEEAARKAFLSNSPLASEL
ncbi:MAG: gfo/Idh/MocA family oxidoreductase [Spirochaetaceae bacterium]|nr:MAG: gfo/Idh/MocA family oxidoreductase [Spirochaetaceae bacterium]